MKKILALYVLCIAFCFSTAYASEQQPVTREDFCTQIYSVLKYTGCFDSAEITEFFTDCDAKAVNLFGTMGIVNGTGGGMFNPEKNITREEAAAIFERFCDYLDLPAGLSEYEYADHSEISDWAKDSVYKVRHSGVLLGTGEGYFSPKALFTIDMTDRCAMRIFNMYTNSNLTGLSFSDKLYNNINTDDNYMISPFSIKTAMMMVANGAEGETQKQILEALGVKDAAAYNEEIKSRISSYEENEVLTMNVANSIWFNKDYAFGSEGFLEPYKQILTEYYDAEAAVVDDSNAVDTINAWVKDKTNEKITNILSEQDKDFTAALVNAVYFNGVWLNEFDKEITYEDEFVNADGTTVTRDFMEQIERLNYAKYGTCKIVELPYKTLKNEEGARPGISASMYIILSDEEVVSPESIISNAEFENKKVNVIIPKFEEEYFDSMKEELISSGIVDAFVSNGQLKGICGLDDMYIDKVLHKTYIKVEEEGTEAAAATVVMAVGGGMPVPEEIVEFKADRPFTYVIKDKTNNEVLFVGRISNLK